MLKKLIPAYLLTFVNTLGVTVLVPVLPFIVEDYNAADWVYGLLLSLYALFEFFGAPILGELSDRYGRKPILIVSQIGTLFSWVVFLIALHLPSHWFLGFALPLWVIFLSRVIDGITGGNTAVTNAYVSDITSTKEKSKIFGYIGGISGVGMIFGPVIGGLSASSVFGHAGAIYAAIIISSITLVSMLLWLEESLPKEERVVAPKSSLIDKLNLLKRIRVLNPSNFVMLLFRVRFLFGIMIAFYFSTIALYVIDLFLFDEKDLGFFMLFIGILFAFNQAIFSKVFIKQFGEFKTLVISLVLTIIGLVCMPFTDDFWIFMIFYFFINLGLSLGFPTYTSLISTYSNQKKQGEVMGINESISAICFAVFPIIATMLYQSLGKEINILISVFPLIALGIICVTWNKFKQELFIKKDL